MHHHFISRFTLSHQAPQKAEKSVAEVLKEDKEQKYAKALSHALSCGQTLSTYFLRVLLFITQFSLLNLYFICEHCLNLGPGWYTSQLLL